MEPLVRAAGETTAAPAPAERDLDGLLNEVAPPPAQAEPGPLLGSLAGWDESGRPLVAYPGGPEEAPAPAQSLVPLGMEHVGREVALLFVGGDPRRPLVIGVLQPPGPAAPLRIEGKVVASVDDDRLEFTAGREIVFRCGDASITLTRAGKVLIQGAYLLSRSAGVNRIKGGSVQIN